MYLANKFQNIKGSADTLLELAEIRMEELAARRRGDGARRAPRRQGSRSPTRSSTAASRSPAPRPTASRRSRSTATPAARTSCSSSGAPTATTRSGCSPSEVLPHFRAMTERPRTNVTRVDEERLVEWASRGDRTSRASPAASRRWRELMARHVRRDGPAGQWQQVEDGPRRTSLGHLGGRRRRAEPDVQRPHGHLVLGPRAVARGRRRLPAARVRQGRPPLRARDLEHEGRARLLRRGACARSRTPACG